MDEKKPYLNEAGDLIIPFECSDNAHKYWKQEGKPLTKILEELDVSQEIWEKYTHEQRNGDSDD